MVNQCSRNLSNGAFQKKNLERRFQIYKQNKTLNPFIFAFFYCSSKKKMFRLARPLTASIRAYSTNAPSKKLIYTSPNVGLIKLMKRFSLTTFGVSKSRSDPMSVLVTYMNRLPLFLLQLLCTFGSLQQVKEEGNIDHSVC
jgi:hypothetical protein